jgi:hypothetical protein
MPNFEENLDLKDITEFIIITATNEFEEISKKITNLYPTNKWPWMFYSENQLLHKNISLGSIRDQLLAISIAPLVKTEKYLLLKYNSLLMNKVNINENIIPTMYVTDIEYPFDYLRSSQLLHQDFDTIQNSKVMNDKVSQIFIKDIVKDLIKWLIDNYGNQKLWQIILVNNRFSEYGIYWSWLIKNNLTDKYILKDN